MHNQETCDVWRCPECLVEIGLDHYQRCSQRVDGKVKDMNCYCGHPESRHEFGKKISELTGMELTDVEGGFRCKHCSCREYAEQSEKEQRKPLIATERINTGDYVFEENGFLRKGELDVKTGEVKPLKEQASEETCCSACFWGGKHPENDGSELLAKPQEASEEKVKPPVPCEKCGGGRFHEADCPIVDKPQEEPTVNRCSGADYHIGNCGFACGEVSASIGGEPREEPKCCEECAPYEGDHPHCKNPACPCHQKESELPKNRPCKHESGTEGNCSKCGASPYPEKESESKERDTSEDNMVAGLIAYGRLNNHIILPRPKGMSIGEAYVSFKDWYQNNAEYAHHFGDISDENWNKLWQEWLQTLKK